MTLDERDEFRADLLRRRDLDAANSGISALVVAYYKGRHHGAKKEELKEWERLQRHVQKAASDLLDALEAIKHSPLTLEHLMYANTYAAGVAVSEIAKMVPALGAEHLGAVISEGREPKYWPWDGCLSLVEGGYNGAFILATLRDFASGDHRPLHTWQIQGQEKELHLEHSADERPDNITPLDWLCYQIWKIVKSHGPQAKWYEDVIKLLDYYGVESDDLKRGTDKAIIERIKKRILRIEEQLAEGEEKS